FPIDDDDKIVGGYTNR
nr:RecName: Full=Trypsin; Flags: Precursor [Felis catus]